MAPLLERRRRDVASLVDAGAARRARGASPQLESTRTPRGHTLRLAGDWRNEAVIAALRAALARCAADPAPLTVDLAAVTAIGNTFTALLLVARGWFDARGGWVVTGASAAVTVTLRHQLAADALLGADR